MFGMGHNIQRQRQDDARLIHALQPKIKQARGDMQALNEIAHHITSIMYGKGLTPQDRENFLAVRFLKLNCHEEYPDLTQVPLGNVSFTEIWLHRMDGGSA